MTSTLKSKGFKNLTFELFHQLITGLSQILLMEKELYPLTSSLYMRRFITVLMRRVLVGLLRALTK